MRRRRVSPGDTFGRRARAGPGRTLASPGPPPGRAGSPARQARPQGSRPSAGIPGSIPAGRGCGRKVLRDSDGARRARPGPGTGSVCGPGTGSPISFATRSLCQSALSLNALSRLTLFQVGRNGRLCARGRAPEAMRARPPACGGLTSSIQLD